MKKNFTTTTILGEASEINENNTKKSKKKIKL